MLEGEEYIQSGKLPSTIGMRVHQTLMTTVGTQVRPPPATPMSAGGDSEEVTHTSDTTEEVSHVSATPPRASGATHVSDTPPRASGVTHVSDTPPRGSGVTHVSDTPPSAAGDAGALAAPDTTPSGGAALAQVHNPTHGVACGWEMVLPLTLFASLKCFLKQAQCTIANTCHMHNNTNAILNS